MADVVAAGMLMLATACTLDSPAAPEFAAGHEDVVLEWGVFHPAHIEWAGITREPQSIEVRETFEVPCWPYTAQAAVRREADTLVLRLTGMPLGGCPQDMVVALSYRATIPLAPAEIASAVRVEHRWSHMPERRYDRTFH